MKIAPSILAADFARLGEQIQEVEAAGVDQIHFDVMDGRFVPNITFGIPVLESVRRITNLPLDVHLMIVEPEHHIQAFANAGADAITVHVEACPHLHRILQQIRALNVKAGVALNPHTPAVMIGEVLHLVDIILVMTVNPGAGGQKFLSETLPKITTLRQMANRYTHAIDIGVDGGIDPSTAPHAFKAGANVLIAGTSIFGAKGGMKAGVEAMRAVILQENNTPENISSALSS